MKKWSHPAPSIVGVWLPSSKLGVAARIWCCVRLRGRIRALIYRNRRPSCRDRPHANRAIQWGRFTTRCMGSHDHPVCIRRPAEDFAMDALSTWPRFVSHLGPSGDAEPKRPESNEPPSVKRLGCCGLLWLLILVRPTALPSQTYPPRPSATAAVQNQLTALRGSTRICQIAGARMHAIGRYLI